MARLDHVRDLAREIARGSGGGAVRCAATVTRVEGGTPYVVLAGTDEEVPVAWSLAEVEAGQSVMATVADGRVTLDGNESSPAVGVGRVMMVDRKADDALDEAGRAHAAADAAEADAARAKEAADDAQSSADAAQASAAVANTAASSALGQLGIVQDVVGVLDWASSHGTFERTSDTAIVDGKVYFTYDAQTGDYTPVVSPQTSALSTYYELSVDEAMESFIMSHLAVTQRGLWVLPSGINAGQVTPASGEAMADARARLGSNYKMLLANDGTYIYDGLGAVVAQYKGDGITYADGRSFHIGSNDAYILYTPANGSTPAKIVIGGSNVQLGSSKTLSEWETDMQQAWNAASAAQSAIDGLEVGGRNFAVEGLLAVGYFDAAGSAFSLHAETSNRERATDYIPVVEGEPVTIQVWIDDTEGWSSFQPWIGFYFYNAEKSSAVGSRRTKTGATGDTYASVTTDVPTGASFLRVSFRYYNSTRVKVERGNVPTDWTPAPEDVRTEAFALSQPNLTPFFSIGVSDNAYWFTTTNMKTYGTALADGWVRLSTFSLNMNISPKAEAVIDAIKPSTHYTVMLEVKNSTVAAPVRLQLYTANNSMWATTDYVEVTGDGTYYVGTTTKADLTASAITHLRIFLQANVTANVSSFAGDVRVSIYEGDYHGPYKPYVADYAKLNEIKSAADEAAKVAGNYIIETSSNDVWVHSEGHGPNAQGAATADTYGWRIGSVFELVRAGLSYIKMWVDNSIAKLRLGLEDAGHVVLDSSGMEVFDGGDSVAAFGSESRIGKAYVQGATDNESHMKLDYHSLQLISKEGTEYFHVSDLRGADGTLEVTDTFTAAASGSGLFVLSYTATNTSYTVKVNGTTVTSDITKSTTAVQFTTAPSAGASIEITYSTAMTTLKALTFGTRRTGKLGCMSVAEGGELIASGDYSHAEGSNSTASGFASHAEGSSTASAPYAHAEGRLCQAKAMYSHAQNQYTRASSACQTVIGKYNIEDDQDEYAFIIGNGEIGDYSDALRVGWLGNVQLAGGIQDMSGNPLIQQVSAESASATSIAAGSYGSCTATLPVPNGYEVVGITGIKTNNQLMLDVNSWSMSGNVVTAYLHNFSTAQQAAKITVYATCINSQLA